MQLPDAGTNSYFTKAFGRPAREQTCECERTAEPSVTQALHVANGDTINKKLASEEGVVAQAVRRGESADKLIDEAFIASLSRLPSEVERKQFGAALNSNDVKEKRLALEDVYWALLSSREFLFNH